MLRTFGTGLIVIVFSAGAIAQNPPSPTVGLPKEDWPLRGGENIVEALTSRSVLIAEGVSVSVGPVRERLRFPGSQMQSLPFPPRGTIKEQDVFLRLTETYKGTKPAGETVAIIRGVFEGRRPIEPGQRFILFLVQARQNELENQKAPILSDGTPRYRVLDITTGMDSISPGFLEIVDGRIRLVGNDTAGEMKRYLGLTREDLLAEVRKYLSR